MTDAEISKGKLAFAHLLGIEIGDKMPGPVGDFLQEVVANRIGKANGHAVVDVALEETVALPSTAVPETRQLQAKATAHKGGWPKGRVQSPESKAKAAATRAANRARKVA